MSPLLIVRNFIKGQYDNWRVIAASARYELKKRYAGSFFGGIWLVVFPLLFLGSYIFIWTFVFPANLPQFQGSRYILFVFSGLIPYLFVMDVANFSVIVIKQNIYMIKGLVISADHLPTRCVIAALISHIVGFSLLMVIYGLSNSFSLWIFLFPFILVLYLMFLLGLAWLLAPVGLVIPDLSYAISLIFTLMAFLSPISFRPEMVPSTVKIIVLLNPLTYVIEAYRLAVFGPEYVELWRVGVFAAMSVGLFYYGALFCARFKDHVLDFE